MFVIIIDLLCVCSECNTCTVSGKMTKVQSVYAQHNATFLLFLCSGFSHHLWGCRNGVEYHSSTLSCPVRPTPLTPRFPYLFYTSLSTWVVVFLFVSFHNAILQTGRVVKGVGHLDHVWSYGVWEVVSSIPDWGNTVGWVFHSTQVTGTVFSFEQPFLKNSEFISNIVLVGSSNYRPSAPFLHC